MRVRVPSRHGRPRDARLLVGQQRGQTAAVPAAGADRELARAVTEVDQSLLDLYRAMTVTERLRAATKHAATIERLRRAASTNR